jgi:site-specific DNA-methyltransferase (adenine-specific)
MKKESIVYLEDCIQGMKRYSDNHFDLAIVDPPYGMMGQKYVTVNKQFLKGKKYTKIDVNSDYGFSLGERPTKEYFNELFRVSKNQIIWGLQYFIDNLKPTQALIIWDKKNGDSKQSSSEIAWTSFDTKVVTFYKDSRNEKRIHPTQKSVYLYDFCLKNYAKEGDLILDTHLGSGSSRIAAYKGGFNFVGFEIDQEYYEKQEKRFNDFKSQLTLF